MNEDNQFGKNYWYFLVLFLLFFILYPYYLKWITPESTGPEAPVEEKIPLPEESLSGGGASLETTALSPPGGPFLEKAPPPTLIHYTNEFYDIEFTTRGGAINRLFYLGETGAKTHTQTLFYENKPNRTGLFGTRLLQQNFDLSRAIFKLVRIDKTQGLFEFAYEKPGDFIVTKTYSVSHHQPVILLAVTVQNLSSRERHFALELDYGIKHNGERQKRGEKFELVVSSDSIKSADLGRVAKKGFDVAKPIDWAGVVKKYFTLLVNPDSPAIANHADADDELLVGHLKMEPLSVRSGASATQNFFIYAGPQRYELLKSFEMGFEHILSRGFLGWLKIWFLIALKFSHRFTHNFGWDIIILTILIKLLFTPLTHMSFENMKKMQALQPKMKSLQERYKKDPARMNQELMNLYKRNRVNPMAGCLPMLFQIPIFIAFYHVLNDAIELRGAPFIFWIKDLSEPDRLFTLPFSLPLLGDAFNFLPILMLGSMFWQQKLTPQTGATPEQTKIFTFMPLIFGFIFYSMPSGLVLYWFVNNILSIIHQVFIKRMVIVLHHEDSH